MGMADAGGAPEIEELVRLDPYRDNAVKPGENKFYSAQ